VKNLESPQGLKTYSLRGRKSKVSIARFAKPLGPEAGIADFLDSLPDFLAARDFREFIGIVRKARERKRPIAAPSAAGWK
jgi:hypothetical protein